MKICTNCETNEVTCRGNNNQWCSECQKIAQKEQRGATGAELTRRAQHPQVTRYTPGDPGFDTIAAQCTHISDIAYGVKPSTFWVE